MSMTFCTAECRPFDSNEFVSWTNGVVIHVITKTAGHTTDGTEAKYEASKNDAGHWTITSVVLDIASLDVSEEE